MPKKDTEPPSRGSDWAPGDYAMCIKRGFWKTSDPSVRNRIMEGPSYGQVLIVKDTALKSYQNKGESQVCKDVGLGFAEFGNSWYRQTRFVKVTPTDDLVEEERQQHKQLEKVE